MLRVLSPVRQSALVLAAALLAAGGALATAGDAGGPAPRTGAVLPETGAVPEGRLATPQPQPLCTNLVPRHHGDEPSGRSAPGGSGLGALHVPILAYHYVRTDRTPGDVLGQRLSVTPEQFAAQMDLLRRSGAHAVTLHDVVAALHGELALPSHPVVLTFDDGYDNFAFNALPVLQRDHLCATLFAVPGFLGRPGYLTAGSLRTVAAAGVRIGAHTVDHLDLTRQPAAAVADQVTRSGDTLRALTGQPVRDFAYPYGTFDATAMAAVQAAGYDDAVALGNGLPESWDGRLALPRVEVVGGESLQQFATDAGVAKPAA